MASKRETRANSAPFDSGKASQIAPLPEEVQAQPWPGVPVGFLDLPGVHSFTEKVASHGH